MEKHVVQVAALLVATYFAFTEGSCGISAQIDLEDFLERVPWSSVREVTYGYLENDEQVQAAHKYLRSRDFLERLLSLEQLTKFSEVISYVKQSGVEVFSLLYSVHNMATPPAHLPHNSTSNPGGSGVQGLVQDILSVLPKLALKVLYTTKCDSSEPFKAMAARLSTQQFQVLVENLSETTDIQDLKKALASNYINIGNIVSTIKSDFESAD